MRYSLSIRQPKSLLEKAEEIRLEYRDINALYDKIEEFPAKEFVVIIPRDAEVDWMELLGFYGKCHLTIAIEDLDMAKKCNEYSMRFFWIYPVTSYYELQGIVKLHASDVVLGAPLYFDLDGVKKMYPDLIIRLVANICDDGMFPRENGVRGTYVRPEDVSVYDPYVYMMMFDTDALSKEEVLFNTYKEGVWPGNLNLLLTNLNYNVDNRGIPDNFGSARIQCRQNCMRTGKCNFCMTAMTFVNAVKNSDDLKQKFNH